jgi:hypothetical protein
MTAQPDVYWIIAFSLRKRQHAWHRKIEGRLQNKQVYGVRVAQAAKVEAVVRAW